ncbi:hypothetical protein JXB12_04145 [candidate division KSB1 bacterium]|nr:hypothetical protein [candidate division KSB1 bacterium]
MKQNNLPGEKLFIVAFIISGFSSMTAQIIILRELMIVFSGNELTVGIGMAVWLMCTAIGSYIISRFISKVSNPDLLFFGMQAVLSVLFVSTIYFIRVSPVLWHFTRGEMSDLSYVLLIPFVTLLPLCVFNGMIYTIGTYILSRIGCMTEIAASRMYLFEAVGAGLATLLGSIFLIRLLDTSRLVTVICMSFILTSSLWSFYYLKKWAYRLCAWFLYVATFSFLLIVTVPQLHRRSVEKYWGEINLIHSETTIYGHIAVTKLGDSISFYESGCLVFTYPDLYYAEESVQFALLQHPEPKNILLIGGGLGGGIEQIMKHPTIDRIDYVELDPAIIRLGRQFLPADVVRFLDHPDVHLHTMDGRVYVKNCQSKYDVVIVNLPDPSTTQINRFYSLDFFKSIDTLLNQGGILGFSVVSSENYISEELAKFLGCLYHTMQQVFEDIVLIPGDSNYFIAANQENYLGKDAQILIDRLHERSLNTAFIREYYLPYRMSTERMDYLIDRIDRPEYRIINTDFKPIANFLNLIVWSTYFNGSVKFVFSRLLQYNDALLFIIPIMLLITFTCWNRFLKNRLTVLKNSLLLSVAMIGFSSMSFEIIIMLGFQAIYGYMYYQLALILATFMIGLSIGSYVSIKRGGDVDKRIRDFIRVQAGIIAFSGALLIMLISSAKFDWGHVNVQLLFAILILTSGFLCGFQFPTATVIYRKITQRIEKVAGVLYAADLLGSCFGALIISAILVPALGIIHACLALVLINTAVVCGLILSSRT